VIAAAVRNDLYPWWSEEVRMMTRREAVIGLLAIQGMGAAGVMAGQEKVLGPTVFNWNDLEPLKTPTGEVRRVCKSPTATLDQLEIHITTLNPGEASHAPHRHLNEELIILREGKCETLSNEKWVNVEPGSIVFNASNSLHAFRNVGTTPATYYVINWSPNKDMKSTR
jgi:mannose-6-phosphate isomerase-like protein (cupin superfamily)